MKRFFKISALVLLIAFATVACKPLSEQIEINKCELASLDNVHLGAGQLSLGTNLKLEADNSSCRDITLQKLSARIYSKGGKEVAQVIFDGKKGEDKPTLHRRSSEEVEIPLEITFDNPLSALSLAAMTLVDYGEKGYTVSYDCTIGAGCFRKKFSGTKVPIEDFVKMLEK